MPGVSVCLMGSCRLYLSLRRLWPPGKSSAWADSQCLSTSTLPMMCWVCGVSWKGWSSLCPRVHLEHQILSTLGHPSETQGYKTCGHFDLGVSQVLKFKLLAFNLRKTITTKSLSLRHPCPIPSVSHIPEPKSHRERVTPLWIPFRSFWASEGESFVWLLVCF